MKIESKSVGFFEHRFFKTGAQALLSVFILLMSNLVMAQASGGLGKATAAANEWKTWAYSFLGVVVFLYLMYHVVMALMDKETWNDVLMALGKVAAAGGVLLAGGWAWSIWGS